MNTFIPFIVKINQNAKTLNVLKSAGDKAFGNPEAAIKYLGGLPENAECITLQVILTPGWDGTNGLELQSQ